jgi:peptidoglycan hydrolase CwlO-like protein
LTKSDEATELMEELRTADAEIERLQEIIATLQAEIDALKGLAN